MDHHSPDLLAVIGTPGEKNCLVPGVLVTPLDAGEGVATYTNEISNTSVLNQPSSPLKSTETAKFPDAGGDFYETIARTEKLPITCRNNHAIFHKSKLGSGKKGKCIEYEGEFFTPSEFENLCGLEMSKDWKRSLHYGGRSLLILINEGIIRPHASTCMCAVCCGNQIVMGPVRYATPNVRRKRRATVSLPSPNTTGIINSKIERQDLLSSQESFALPTLDAGYDIEKDLELPQNLFALIRNSNPSHNSATQQLLNAISEAEKQDLRIWERLHKKTDVILKKVVKLQETIVKTKKECNERRNNLLKDIFDVLRQQGGSNGYASPAKLMRFDKSVEDQEKLDDDTQDEDATEICHACGSPANSECTGCHKATYCSTKCQEKDWKAGHRDICRQLLLEESDSRQGMYARPE